MQISQQIYNNNTTTTTTTKFLKNQQSLHNVCYAAKHAENSQTINILAILFNLKFFIQANVLTTELLSWDNIWGDSVGITWGFMWFPVIGMSYYY